MPPIDLPIFAALLAAAAILALRPDRFGRNAFLLLAGLALLFAGFALWSLRWQAAAGLIVAAITALMGLWWRKRGDIRHPLFTAALIALAAIASASPYHFLPVFDLPTPDGPYRIGVRDLDLRDDTRRGVMFTPADAPRDLPVTIWYPAAADAKGPRRPYWTRREALDEGRSLATLWGFASFRFLSFHSAGTHGIQNAAVAPGGKFPVVIFNHGYFSARAQNTALMERLASHGYIVVSVAHPRDGADVRLADGTLIPTAPHDGPGGIGDPTADKRWEDTTAAFMGGDSHARRIAALPAYRDAVAGMRLGQSLVAWREDALFVARRLRLATPPALAPIVAAVDTSRTIYAGMSFGGSTATSACDADPHCAAAIDLDGENFDGAQFDRAIRAPLLLILTDQPFTESMRVKKSFNPTDYAWERWHCLGERPDILRLRARGMLHMGLTDFPLSARPPFLSDHFTRLDGGRAVAMINDAVLAFLDQHVHGKGPAGMQAVLVRYPEYARLDTRSLKAHAAALPGREPCR